MKIAFSSVNFLCNGDEPEMALAGRSRPAATAAQAMTLCATAPRRYDPEEAAAETVKSREAFADPECSLDELRQDSRKRFMERLRDEEEPPTSTPERARVMTI
jgi:hypothetical protein